MDIRPLLYFCGRLFSGPPILRRSPQGVIYLTSQSLPFPFQADLLSAR